MVQNYIKVYISVRQINNSNFF